MSKEEIKELLREFFIDYDTHRWSNDGVYEKYTELLYKPISDLEAKLAESEKERHEEWKTGKEWKWEWQKVNQKLEKAEQDKISFAIAELEKLKEHFINIKTPTLGVIRRAEMIMYIDNQIKQLKEGK